MMSAGESLELARRATFRLLEARLGGSAELYRDELRRVIRETLGADLAPGDLAAVAPHLSALVDAPIAALAALVDFLEADHGLSRRELIDALDEILEETDAVMVARGDLGVEIGPAAVPLIQKRIIGAALGRGKPVITATQMLESMVHAPDPTRAEASDVANAILDGSSALMLSGETAVGQYPVEAVEYMDRIACAIEPSLGYRHELPRPEDRPTVGQAMSNAACDLAEALAVRAILVPTFSGRTASAVARLRPRRPIVALTHHSEVASHLALEWGVTPVVIPECRDVTDLWSRSLSAARETGLVREGDLVVLTAGTAVNIPGSTNVIKVEIA